MQLSNDRFSVVVLPHLEHAYRLAHCLTGSSADSEDVVQEAMIRMIRSIDGYRGGDAKSWVLAVIRNTTWTWLRANRRSGHVPFDEDLGNAWGTSPEDPAAIELMRSESDALRAAITALPPQQRELVTLRDLKGFSYREIAAALCVPIGTVMSRLCRAHRALERSLAHEATSAPARLPPRRCRHGTRARTAVLGATRRVRRSRIAASWKSSL